MSHLILAQAEAATALGGAAGWAGAGLLGLVLAWLLLVHLPSKDKQQKDYISDKDQQLLDLLNKKDMQILTKDEQIKAMHNDNWTNIEALQCKFAESLEKLIAHHKEEINRIIRHLEEHDESKRKPNSPV